MIKYSIITPYGQYVMMGHWTMREHTLKELDKMEQVRNYLISNQAIDADGFVDFLSEIQ